MSAYIPTPLSDAWQKVIIGQETVAIVLGDFLDDWRRTLDRAERIRLIDSPICDPEDADTHRWACFMAATVEYLSVRDGIPTPSWVYDTCWTLPEPWFLITHWKWRAWLLVATPPPWKRRRIFGGDETMLIGRV
ncbi:MAG: hypothetical protein C7B45_08765 [Sulfobacillus acidophilus]|uniref:Uncharacterized protein n=1 Tax=Sulfobacillus acidophilus TaxID=53633 RepID=A0A2T2WIA6_9FIRM|nr:MAG: hypothetical protein C7B45_08765 [Sulfobacillus acidophilus]